MSNNRRAILHVDDDALFTQLAAQHFIKAGYGSEAVIDPMVAMQSLIRGKYRVVVLDVQMPKKSGLQLLQEIKQYDAGIQVILLTSLVRESTIVEAGRLGAEACFFKPLTNSQPLLEAIEDAFVRGDRWCSTMQDLVDRRNLQAGSPSA